MGKGYIPQACHDGKLGIIVEGSEELVRRPFAIEQQTLLERLSKMQRRSKHTCSLTKRSSVARGSGAMRGVRRCEVQSWLEFERPRRKTWPPSQTTPIQPPPTSDASNHYALFPRLSLERTSGEKEWESGAFSKYYRAHGCRGSVCNTWGP